MTEPTVERRRGGWFVIDEGPQGWSGPWRTEAAALMARAGEYDKAHEAEREDRALAGRKGLMI